MPPLPKTSFALVALVAILVQSLIVQTHIHHPVLHPLQAGTGIIAPDGASPAGAPLKGDDDSSTCALCQAFAHTGHFLHSAVLLICALVLSSVQLIRFTNPLPIRFAVSHNWHGRAPPLI